MNYIILDAGVPLRIVYKKGPAPLNSILAPDGARDISEITIVNKIATLDPIKVAAYDAALISEQSDWESRRAALASNKAQLKNALDTIDSISNIAQLKVFLRRLTKHVLKEE